MPLILGGDKQKGEYIEGKIKDNIDEIEANHGEKIVAVVSDAGSNYLSARQHISASNPRIFSVTCAAHMVNLLAGDITKLPSLTCILTKSKKIVKEIRGSKTKIGEFREEFKRYAAEEKESGIIVRPVSLGLYSVTRWYGIRDMLYKLRRSKPVLMRLAIKESFELDSTVRRTIKDDRFWLKLENVFPLYSLLAESKLPSINGHSAMGNPHLIFCL